jgi:hypothetical protein
MKTLLERLGAIELQTTPLPCAIHSIDHPSPTPKNNHWHHIIPLGWGGSDVKENQTPLCPTSHENIHHLLRAYVKNDGPPPWSVLLRYGEKERQLAKAAWEGR